MCGVTGFISKDSNFSNQELDNLVREMSDQLYSRGPDSSGTWVDQGEGVAFGHRRLAILDLSSAGHQPMLSKSERFVLTYNGEIYNHLDLRKELEVENPNISWKGSSDTETILAAIDTWGFENSLKKFNGMFALALWDRKLSKLFLARDRIGEKPLYYGWQKNSFLFASELKSLRKHHEFCHEIDKSILSAYLRHSYVPAPHSIYKGISKLIPGTFLEVDTAHRTSKLSYYWSIDEVVTKGLEDPFTGTDKQALNFLEETLSNAVQRQTISDVPLGAFLSGGIDSSLITSLMQSLSETKVRSFSIGFKDPKYDEAVYAKEVARHIGTDHTEMYVTSSEVTDVIPNLSKYYSEPFADSSQIPTFLVSQIAKSKVTVALSGDAGDELFGGYNRYFWANRLWNKLKYLPLPLRVYSAKLITLLSPLHWEKLLKSLMRLAPERSRVATPGEKMHKIAHILDSRSKEEIYMNLISLWKSPPLTYKNEGLENVLSLHDLPDSLSSYEYQMMYLDTLTYLPDDILTKVDRAAMAVSLETRIPFLDLNVIELSWKLPFNMKIRDQRGKWLLRELLYKFVPPELIERPKQGFGIPIGEMLKGPLKDWAESLLQENKLKEQNYFSHKEIRAKWKEHLSGKMNWQHQLWSILMFQSWLEEKDSV